MSNLAFIHQPDKEKARLALIKYHVGNLSHNKEKVVDAVCSEAMNPSNEIWQRIHAARLSGDFLQVGVLIDALISKNLNNQAEELADDDIYEEGVK